MVFVEPCFGGQEAKIGWNWKMADKNIEAASPMEKALYVKGEKEFYFENDRGYEATPFEF